MRPLVLATLILGLAALGCNAHAVPMPRKQHGTPPPKKEDNPTWKVDGPHAVTTDEAWEAALTQAQSKLVEHLHSQSPPVEWVPTTKFIHDKMVTRSAEDTQELNDPIPVTMRRVRLEIELKPQVMREIREKDRDYRVRQRMITVGMGLGVLVLFLAGISAYLRFDDWSKGYYTTWLKVGALAFVLAAGLGLLLVN
jgi:hypothetical protein